MNRPKFDFDDILITPEIQTTIKSRYADVNPYYTHQMSSNVGRLPLFTAPMDTVVSVKNMFLFQNNKINVVLSRTEPYKGHWCQFNSFGLTDEVEADNLQFALIDVANGHMEQVIQWAENIKWKNPKAKIMAGNIANPQTYKLYCESGVIDYARVGIGNGGGCLTTQQTGVGYPMGSLISECYEIKLEGEYSTYIVADGGMKKYSDIIKALALGADFVMIGNIFNKALESAAPTYWGKLKVGTALAAILYEAGCTLHKEYRGMSTKQAQVALGNKNPKTSEGIIKRQEVEYTLSKWVENFESYLRSAMSYTNSRTLIDFIGKANIELITKNSYLRFNK